MGAYVSKPLPRRTQCKYYLFGILSRMAGKKCLIRAQLRLATLKDPLQSEISALVVSMAGDKTHQRTGHYLERIEVCFEKLHCFAPAAYDRILQQVYGDYRVPPMPDQRDSLHQIVHVDLHKSYLSHQ